MIRDVLSAIDGIEIYPLAGLILFFLIFASCIIWVVRLDKSHIEKMGNMPLDTDEINNDFKGNKNE